MLAQSVSSIFAKMVRISIIKCVIISSLAISSLITILMLRALIYFSKPLESTQCEYMKEHKSITNERKIVDRFVQSLKIPTITKSPKVYNRTQILSFIDFLKQSEYFLCLSKTETKILNN
jgi:hypothetical protein